MTPVLTHHALDRYRIRYPDASEVETLWAVQDAIDISPDIALSLAGRSWQVGRGTTDTYRLHRDRSGIFVLDGRRVITFLRFYGHTQQDLARRLYPPPREAEDLAEAALGVLGFAT